MARVGAVLLAAGASERFGPENKLLAPLGGVPLVRRVAKVLLASAAREVVAVTGHDAERCREALDGLPVRVVWNAEWERGMGASIAAGVTALPGDLDGAFIVPGDMAALAAALIDALAAEFARADGSAIVHPVTPAGEQRNPVLWPRRFFPDLARLSGGEGAKALIAQNADACRTVTVAEADLADIDTPSDLDAAERRLAADVAQDARPK